MKNLITILPGLLAMLVVLVALAECMPAPTSTLREDYLLDELDDDYNGEDLIEKGYVPLELINGKHSINKDDSEEMMEIQPSDFALNDETYENGVDDGTDDDMIVGSIGPGLKSGN